MEHNEWINYFDGDEECVNIVYRLQKETPYTDEYIKEAIEKIGETYFTKRKIIFAIYASELMTLK